MPEVRPLRALHYDLEMAGPLDRLIAPPYDVIDAAGREELAGRAHNVVHLDLPDDPAGGDRYARAAALLAQWRADGVLVHDERPALWALEQRFNDPDGKQRTRRGVLARIRADPYAAAGVRPHERTQPGPKADRLALTRATRANLSPIFALHSDPQRAVAGALEPHMTGEPWAEGTDAQGTQQRLWRVGDPTSIRTACGALAASPLLIADGHHRYETARAYADEVGGEGPHRYVLALLVALEDPGLAVFPTHRLLHSLGADGRGAQPAAIDRDWLVEPVEPEMLVPPPPQPGRPLQIGYLDAFQRRPLRLTLRDQEVADRALPGRSRAFRRLDTAVVEALLLRNALGRSEEEIARKHGLDYARSFAEARQRLETGAAEVALFMAPTPVELVQAIARDGESMPPKSTFFYPKVPTGLLISPLDAE